MKQKNNLSLIYALASLILLPTLFILAKKFYMGELIIITVWILIGTIAGIGSAIYGIVLSIIQIKSKTTKTAIIGLILNMISLILWSNFILILFVNYRTYLCFFY